MYLRYLSPRSTAKYIPPPQGKQTPILINEKSLKRFVVIASLATTAVFAFDKEFRTNGNFSKPISAAGLQGEQPLAC